MYPEFASELVRLIQTAPDSQIDAIIIEQVRQWPVPPKAVEILETLDTAVHGGLAITMMDLLLQQAAEHEGVELASIYAIADATWRVRDHA